MRLKTPVMLATALAMTVGATAMAAENSQNSRQVPEDSRAQAPQTNGAQSADDCSNGRAGIFCNDPDNRLKRQPSGAADCSNGQAGIYCNDPDNRLKR